MENLPYTGTPHSYTVSLKSNYRVAQLKWSQLTFLLVTLFW